MTEHHHRNHRRPRPVVHQPELLIWQPEHRLDELNAWRSELEIEGHGLPMAGGD